MRKSLSYIVVMDQAPAMQVKKVKLFSDKNKRLHFFTS